MNTTMNTIKLHNVKHGRIAGDLQIYCGRGTAPKGMLNANMGNPHTMASEAFRDLVCDKYAQDLAAGLLPHHEHQIAKMRDALKTKSIALYCWCAPLRCHCNTIVTEVLKP